MVETTDLLLFFVIGIRDILCLLVSASVEIGITRLCIFGRLYLSL
jgi:hypothetical protein